MEIRYDNLGKCLVPTCVTLPFSSRWQIAPGEQSRSFLLLSFSATLAYPPPTPEGSSGDLQATLGRSFSLLWCLSWVERKGWSSGWSHLECHSRFSLPPALPQPQEDPGAMKHLDLCFFAWITGESPLSYSVASSQRLRVLLCGVHIQIGMPLLFWCCISALFPFT